MKSWYSKLIVMCLMMLVPLQLFEELIIFVNSKPVSLKDFNSYSIILRGLIPAYFKGFLAILFCVYAIKKFSPKLTIGLKALSLLKALIIAIIVFSITKLLPLISSDTSTATYLLEPIIPGLRNWFVVVFLTVGVMETFRYKFDGIKLAAIFVGFYSIYLYAGQFHLNLLPDPTGLGEFSLLSAPTNLFHWSYILPSTVVIYSVIIYLRLGLVPSLFFTFAIGSMGMMYSLFNPKVIVDNSIMNHYLTCIVISTLLIRYLKKSTDTDLDTYFNKKKNDFNNVKELIDMPLESADE